MFHLVGIIISQIIIWTPVLYMWAHHDSRTSEDRRRENDWNEWINDLSRG